MKHFLLIFCLFITNAICAQDIALFKQFNGNYDYTAFGNTLNITENGQNTTCDIRTSSSANLQLLPGQEVVAAYLYWAGSGPGDFDITLNQFSIAAERTFNVIYNTGGVDYIYFAAVTDVTQQIKNMGNGNYTVANLDLTSIIPSYCSPFGSGTNFGGWTVMVVYEENNLPLNQVTIFDGLQNVSRTNQTLDITINNLLVRETQGAKIGFLAWEGDSALAENETLRINGNILSNPPLNPATNAFNGTNTFTGSNTLYNMDIDVYSISNFINPGDTSATIQLTSSQDFVMVNNIVTVLNTELPDATITMDTITGDKECGNRTLQIDFTVSNTNSTDVLPAGTPIAFYANGVLVAQGATIATIAINGEENQTIAVTIPNTIPADFILKAVVDDTGNGTGIVKESNEENNEAEKPIHLFINPIITGLKNLEICDAVGEEFFDLTQATSQIDPSYTLSFHLSETDAEDNIKPIENPERFQNTENPQTIYIRVSNPDCYLVASFKVEILDCPLPDATIVLPEISACRERALLLPFTVFNTNATAPLPANVPIAFYIGENLLGQTQTKSSIAIDDSETGAVEIFLPDSLPDTFTLTAVVDDDGNGNGTIEELIENNNGFTQTIAFESIPPLPNLPNLLVCDEGFNTAIFDLTVQDTLIRSGVDDTIAYFTTLDDALQNTNPIQNASAYKNTSDPQTIYVLLENDICFATTSFLLETENCAPFIPEGFSPNNDGINDVFEITNLLNIYENFELNIYTRNGNLIHTAKNADGFWNGMATRGLLFTGKVVPVGTYYYVLVLNDPKYPEAFIGWVYVNY